MKVGSVCFFLKNLYPLDAARNFDNVGLLVGDSDAEISNVLIALDCTEKTVETAIKNNCNLIITHHPVIFDGIKNVLADSVVYRLIKNDISVISMHTNLDMGEGGVNDCLCNRLGLCDITAFTADDGFILRCGTYPDISADDFADNIKKALNVCVKYVDGGKPIRKVLVCSGGGGDYLFDAIKGGFDALVTADIKHHLFICASDNGISLFDAGHFNTEDTVVEPLKTVLQNQFPQINFITCHLSDIKYSV